MSVTIRNFKDATEFATVATQMLFEDGAVVGNMNNQLALVNRNICLLGTATAALSVAAIHQFYTMFNQGAQIANLDNKFAALDQKVAALVNDTNIQSIAQIIQGTNGPLSSCKLAYDSCQKRTDALKTQVQKSYNNSLEFEKGWEECLTGLEACEKNQNATNHTAVNQTK